jgi:hypothetical protein
VPDQVPAALGTFENQTLFACPSPGPATTTSARKWLASIEKIGLGLSGLMQNGADQDKARLLGVKHRMSLKAEATKTGRDLVHGPPDAGKAGEQVECALRPCVIGVGLIGSESFVV